MPLPDADKKSPRVYTNLQNLDLDKVTFANIQSTGNPIAVEEMNEDEMRRLVLVNLARLVTAGEWTGLLEAGGGEFNAVITNADDINSPYNLNRIDSTPPWGMNTGNNSVGSRDEPMFLPFIAPETSTVAGIVIDCASAAGSSVNGVVAIYSDEDGVPKTKLGSDATFDMTTTGQKEQTSVGTISLTKGTQYWVGWVRSGAVSCSWSVGTSAYPWSGPTENLSSSWAVLWIPSGSNNTLPATVTSTDLEPRGYSKISVGLNQ